MKLCQAKLLLIPLLFVSLISCENATYSKEKVEQSVMELCKNEYDLDVEVKIIGSTLGVYIPIDGLVNPDMRLNQEAGEKIEDVALSIHRVVMSTDRPLNFYTLTARDTESIGAEFTLTGYIYDVVRVRLLDISRGEYHKRILRDFRLNPVVVGEIKIKELFHFLNEDAAFTEKVKNVFYPIFIIGEKGSQKIEIVDIDAKEISNQEALFYVNTKEYYNPSPGFEVYRAIFPPGFKNEYLILINMAMFPNLVKETVSKYFYSGTEIRQRDLKESFNQYVDVGYVGADGFPKRDLKLDWFLSRQIATKIMILFNEDKRLKEAFHFQSSGGSVDNKIFRFEFNVSPEKPSDKDKEMLYSKILDLAASTFHRYDFEDFEGIELVDMKLGSKKISLTKDELEKFRRGKIKLKDIL